MSVDVLILVLSNVTNLLIGAGVFLRGPKLPINRAFAVLSLSIVAWTSCNFIADNTSTTELATLFGRLTIIFGLTILLSVLVFSRVFPRGDLQNQPILNSYQLPAIFGVILLSLTPLIIESVEPANDSANLIVGPLYVVFIFVLMQGIIIATMNFMQQY